MLLLFGAGASYGAGGIIPETPPLGPDLYSRLVTSFPNTWGRLHAETPSNEIHTMFSNESFEKGMELLRNRHSDYLYYWNEAAIYFSRFKIDDASKNAYCRLIDRWYAHIQSKGIVLSTLNYECLIDQAIARHNPQITYWGADAGIRLLKVHGSCNFLPAIDLQGTTKLLLPWPAKSYVPIQPCGELERIEESISAHNVRGGIPVAMHLYTEDKDAIGGGKELELVLKEFHECIRAARLAIVVGVRPNPDDRHIWDYLGTMAGKLRIVGKQADCEEWQAKYRPGESSIWLASKFADALPLIFEEIDQAIF